MRHALIAAIVSLVIGGSATPAVAWQDQASSPAITALTRDPTTEGAFWRTVERAGTPIVEPSPTDPNRRLVTFVWRGEAEQVGVITPLSLLDIENGRMQRVPNTTTWWRSYDLPTSTIFAYRFAANDTFTPFDREPNFFQRLQTWAPDSNNHERFNFGAGPDASVLDLDPTARPLWAERRGVRRGELTTETTTGATLGERRVQIYRPAGAGANAPILILMDGSSYLSQISAATILDNLIADGAIPPVVAAFVDAGDDRESDYRCNPNWTEFLTNDLLPSLRARYASRSETVIVGGYSLGGLAAACAALARPDVFDHVILQSASLYSAPAGEPPEWVARTLAARDHAAQSWYVEVGQLETASFPSRDPSMLTSSRHLRDVLVARGYPVRYHEYYGGHEHLAWRASFGDALSGLFSR